jgi:hypothetical protein
VATGTLWKTVETGTIEGVAGARRKIVNVERQARPRSDLTWWDGRASLKYFDVRGMGNETWEDTCEGSNQAQELYSRGNKMVLETGRFRDSLKEEGIDDLRDGVERWTRRGRSRNVGEPAGDPRDFWPGLESKPPIVEPGSRLHSQQGTAREWQHRRPGRRLDRLERRLKREIDTYQLGEKLP